MGFTVDETEVGVQVADGVVTLTGTVTSWAKRVAAQEARTAWWASATWPTTSR